MRLTRLIIEHGFTVAMISGDEGLPLNVMNGGHHGSDALIQALDRFDRG